MAEDPRPRFKLRKTRWGWHEKAFLQSVVTVTDDEVWIGEEGTVRSSIDGGGSRYAFYAFLKGEGQWFIKDPAMLAEIIASVRMLLPEDPPPEKMPEIQRLLEYLQQIPIDPELTGLNRRGSLEDGSRICAEQQIQWMNSPAGVVYKIPFYECVIDRRPRAIVPRNDEVHFVIDQTFAVSDRTGKWIQSPAETRAIFGDCLLIDNVYCCNDIVFYSYFWMYRKFPDGLLRYEKGKGFTGRFEANPSWKTLSSFAAKDWYRDLKPATHARLVLSSPVFSLRGTFKPEDESSGSASFYNATTLKVLNHELAVIVSETRSGLVKQMGSGKKTIWEIVAPAKCGCLSPDGSILALGTDRSIDLWDLKTGKLQAKWTGHSGPLHCVSFSPDGSRLVSAGADRSVKVWDVAAGKIISEIRIVFAAMRVVFHPNGRYVGIKDEQGCAYIWDGDRHVGALTDHSGVLNVAFTPDGMFCVCGDLSGAILLWDLKTGELYGASENTTDVPACLALSPDGLYAAAGSWSRVHLWNEYRYRANHAGSFDLSPQIRDVAFSPASRFIGIVNDRAELSISPIKGEPDRMESLIEEAVHLANASLIGRRASAFDMRVRQVWWSGNAESKSCTAWVMIEGADSQRLPTWFGQISPEKALPSDVLDSLQQLKSEVLLAFAACGWQPDWPPPTVTFESQERAAANGISYFH